IGLRIEAAHAIAEDRARDVEVLRRLMRDEHAAIDAHLARILGPNVAEALRLQERGVAALLAIDAIDQIGHDARMRANDDAEAFDASDVGHLLDEVLEREIGLAEA